MEKISGIIPRNARNSTADLSKSQPVRPGAPSFGRAIGKVSTKSALDNLQGLSQKEQKVSGSSLPGVEDKLSLSEDFQEISDAKNIFNETEGKILEGANAEDKFFVSNENKVKKDLATKAKGVKQNQELTEDEEVIPKAYNKKGEAEKVMAVDEITRKFNRWEV